MILILETKKCSSYSTDHFHNLIQCDARTNMDRLHVMRKVGIEVRQRGTNRIALRHFSHFVEQQRQWLEAAPLLFFPMSTAVVPRTLRVPNFSAPQNIFCRKRAIFVYTAARAKSVNVTSFFVTFGVSFHFPKLRESFELKNVTTLFSFGLFISPLLLT